MMKNHPIRSLLVGNRKKVMPVAAFTFFLCLASSSLSITNTVSGIAYGTDYTTLATSSSISSVSNGPGSIAVGFTGTTNITLNHNLTGLITVTNSFDRFTISGGNSIISNSSFSALAVEGGTNLYLDRGTYRGIALNAGFVLPPVQGKPVMTNEVPSASMGGVINGTENVTVAGTDFSGSALKDTSGNVTGLDGLLISDSSIVFTSTGAVNAVVLGGNAGTATSTANTFSLGGNGLTGFNSDIVISNGTFQGGSADSATASENNSAVSQGGSAIYLTATSSVEIVAGSYTGGSAGAATSNGGSTLSQGGAALELHDNSTAIIHGGIFAGGSGTPAIRLWDSHLTTYGGSFNDGGLYSESTGGTNNLNLLGGSFSSISLVNSTNGHQKLTINGDASVTGSLIQNGGSVSIDNLENDALQSILLLDGDMTFLNDYAQSSNGIFMLNGNSTMATFEQNLDIAGEFDIGSAQVETLGDLDIRNGSTLKFQMLSSTESGKITAGSTSFEVGSTLLVDASTAGFSTGSETITILSTTGGISGFSTNNVSTTILTTTDTNVTGRTTVSDILMGNNLSFVFNTDTFSNYWDATGQLAEFADELDEIDDSSMNAIINNLGSAASKTAVEQSYFTTLNTMQTSLMGLNAALGQAFSRGTEFRETLNLPKGAKGPEELETDWRFWVKYYGQFYTHSKNDETEAYDTTLHGGVFGIDKSFGPLLIGLSGGMGNYRTESDNDAEERSNAAHGAIYSTIGKGLFYLDAGIAYGYNKVESDTGDIFMLEGDFDSQIFSGYLGGGIGFEVPKMGAVITPEASIQYSTYSQEAYTESSAVAIPRSFDEFDADSLRSSLGVNVAMLNTKANDTFSFKVEGRLHWLREFNAEAGDLDFQLVGGANEYQIASPSLDEDTFRAGIGFSFFNTAKNSSKNIMLRLDFDELFGEDFNSHNLAAKAIFAF